jgi:hypothetical protein
MQIPHYWRMFSLYGYRIMVQMATYLFLAIMRVAVVVDGDDSGIELLGGGGKGFHGAFLV